MVIGIIGAGASGMAAAITAGSNPNNRIILFERQSRVGRKLQATGNGRCNLTNISDLQGHYHGEDPLFAEYALSKMNANETIAWFSKLGLFTVSEPSGKVYPYSDQANSVVDVLRFALDIPNITVNTGCEVKKITRDQDGFLILTDDAQVSCDRVIIACGGIAGTKLGGSLSGYKLLSKFGHRCTQLRPSLVQLRTDWHQVTALKGVRAQCAASIYKDGISFRNSYGEIQFTEYGISGPVIFEISRDVCAVKGNWTCRMDFLPHISENELLNELRSRYGRNITTDDLLTGIIHNKLGRVLTKSVGIAGGAPIGSVSESELKLLCNCVKNFEISISEPLGMDSAQVTAGGVLTNEFDPKTMESKLVKGLFACGEVLDIDGDCGGYNLQWAWSSGCCAGYHAGKESK